MKKEKSDPIKTIVELAYKFTVVIIQKQQLAFIILHGKGKETLILGYKMNFFPFSMLAFYLYLQACNYRDLKLGGFI